MRFMTADFLVPFVGITAIVTSMSLFYFDYTKKVEVGSQKRVGTVTFKRLVAQRKYGNQVVWEEVDPNTPVYNFDSIRTADLSDAVIKLNDGTEIALSENSLIVLSFSKEEFDIDFKQGNVSAKRDITGKDVKKLNIKSKDTVITVSNADLNLSMELGKELGVTLTKGNASILSGNTKKELKENQKLIVARGKLDLVELNLKLISPAPHKYYLITSKSERVSFAWQDVKDDNDVFFEVSRDRSFKKHIVRKKTAQNSDALNLGNGNFYWRISAINRKNKKKSFSETRRLSIVENRPVLLIAPRNNTRISYKAKIPAVNFKWSRNELASNYRLLIYKDPELKTQVKTIGMNGTGIAVKDLQNGTYFWRVSSITSLGDNPKPSFSKTYKLIIDQNKLVEPPKLVFPPNNNKFNQLVLDKRSIIFTWKKNPEIPRIRFQVAKDNKFSGIIHSAESTSNYNRLKKKLAVGEYFWRVTGIMGKDIKPINSLIRKFVVTKPGKLRLLAPVENYLALPRGRENFPGIKFTWGTSGIKGRYNIQVSNNRGFTSIFRQVNRDALTQTINRIDPGRYFWRVQFFDTDNTLLMTSGVRTITSLGRLKAPEIVGPAEGNTVDMSRSDTLSLKWKNLRGSDYFKIALYHKKRGTTRTLLDLKTKGTEYTFKDLSKLEEGNFYWTIQAMDLDNNRKNPTNKIIRRSPLVKSNFEISLKNKNLDDVKRLKLPSKIIIQ